MINQKYQIHIRSRCDLQRTNFAQVLHIVSYLNVDEQTNTMGRAKCSRKLHHLLHVSTKVSCYSCFRAGVTKFFFVQRSGLRGLPRPWALSIRRQVANTVERIRRSHPMPRGSSTQSHLISQERCKNGMRVEWHRMPWNLLELLGKHVPFCEQLRRSISAP